MVQISGEHFNPCWSMCLGKWQKYTRPFLPLAKDEELKGIKHSIRFGNLILRVNSVTVSCFIHFDTLLQNGTYIITKCYSYFITKCNRSLLQNATIVTNCDNFVTKCHSYYKMRHLLQIAKIQTIYFTTSSSRMFTIIRWIKMLQIFLEHT